MSAPRALALVLAILVLDQASKHLVLERIAPMTGIEVTSFLNIVLVWNPGISFGLFASGGAAGTWLLVALTLAIAVALVVWFWRERRGLPRLALALVLAGAAGNLIDRLRFGAVVDFLDFHLQGYHWPAFNVADSAIVAGAALLMMDGLFLSRTTSRQGEEK